MTFYADRVRATDPPDVITMRIEELRVLRGLATEDFDQRYLDGEIEWAEQALELSADVVRTADGLTYYKNSPA